MVTKSTWCKIDTPKNWLSKLCCLLSSIALIFLFGASAVQAQTTVNLSPSDSGPWVCPVGVSSITIECWGGGGAGGGATGSLNAAGGGGAGGSYVKRINYPVTPGMSYNFLVGSGGNGGTGDGGDGGNTWFGSSSTIVAVGGNGGNRASSINSRGTGGAKKTTGNLGFTTGYSYYGGKGADGVAGSYGGGGGSSAGTGNNGNDATNRNGASAVTGGSAGVSGATSGSVTTTPAFGGGGGAARATSSTDRSGGDGGPGKISITYTQLTYKAQILSIDAGSSNWCAGETRNVSVQIKNTGTATWSDASPDINIGIKWNTNGSSWNNYYVKVNAGTLAPNATGTYVLPVTASNYTNAGGYTTPLSDGTNKLTVDVIYESVSNFGDNNGGVGPGNSAYATPNQTISSNATLNLSSAAGTNAQGVCQGNAITNITYQLAGGATGANVTGLPAGVNGSYNSGSKVFTISGTPSVSGSFSYTVTTEGSCGTNSLSGTIDVAELATLTLTSAASTTNQTLCMNSPIANITYLVGGSGSGGNVTGLPAGVTGIYADGVITISGSPTVSGTFNFSVTATSSCSLAPLTGTLVVGDGPTGLSVTPSSATICSGESSSLTGNASINASSTILSENFNGTPGVTVTGTADDDGQVWARENNGSNVNGFQSFNSPNGGGIEVAMAGYSLCFSFSGCTASTNSTMKMPSFSTINLNSATISWVHAYKQGENGSSGVVQISTNGTNWTTLKTYSSNVGGANAFVTETINLDAAYLNKPSVSVRFVFASSVKATFFSSASAWWAIDDFAVSGNSLPAYTWSTDTAPAVNGLPAGAGTASSSNAAISVNPSQTTTYTLIAYNPVTGCSASLSGSQVVVNQNSTISLSSELGTDNQTVCFGSLMLPVTYAIGGGGNGALISGLPPSFQGSFADGVFTIIGGNTADPGTYHYTVTTTGSCEQTSASGTIIVSAPVDAVTNVRNVSVCSSSPDGGITLSPVGGTAPYSFQWSGVIGSGNPATTPYTGGTNSATITNLQYGFYNVEITDAKGCTKSISNIHVKKAYLPVITHNGEVSSSCGNTGTLVIYAQAGVAPYTYSVDGSNYQVSNIITGLPAGPLTIYVKDAGGCVGTKDYTVLSAAPIVVNPYVHPSTSCNADGFIKVYRTGGISPYTYSMDGVNYQGSNQFNGLAANTYTVYVKDSKGCVASANATVTQGAGLSVSANRKTNSSPCINDGSFQISVSGGTAPYSYSVNGGAAQQSNTFAGLPAGNYVVTVTDNSGCTGSVNVTINVSYIGVTNIIVNAPDCNGTGAIKLMPGAGTSPWTYSLDGNNYQASPWFYDLVPGTYTGYIKDSKTCIGQTAENELVVGPAECIQQTRSAVKMDKANGELVVGLKAYPNPSSGEFNLQIGQYESGAVVEVRDILGKLIYQTSKLQKSNLLIGAGWKPGVYFVKVITGNETRSIKLIKQ